MRIVRFRFLNTLTMLSENEQCTPVAGIKSALLNSVFKVFWSVLWLAPVYLFCSHSVTLVLLYAFGGTSLLPYLLPISVIDRLGLGSSPTTYRRLGVAFVNRFTQDGVLVRKFAKAPGRNRSLLVDHAVIARRRRGTFQRERFHLAGLLFFLLLTGRAIWLGKSGWTLWLLTSNIIYNAYPVLLQQYSTSSLPHIAPTNSWLALPQKLGFSLICRASPA